MPEVAQPDPGAVAQPDPGAVAQADPGAVAQGQLLWEPPTDARATTRMGRFLDQVSGSLGLQLPDYDTAWRWSVSDPEAFWSSVVDWFDLRLGPDPGPVLVGTRMPDVRWFPGARLNYAAHALRRRDAGTAIVGRSQTRPDVELSFAELADQVGRCAAGLRRLGVARGDRVVAYLPNIPETVVAFLACASLGAVWSSCAPEFGARAVLDRVGQIGPRVLLAVDGYRYGDKDVRRDAEVAAIRSALPTLQATVWVPYLAGAGHGPPAGPSRTGERDAVVGWDELLAEPAEPRFELVPFDHPLYVLFSSGTTGPPKAIVHGHGGILLEHAKMLGLHHDLGPGEVFTWFTTTGWMMWNYLVSGLVVGATVVLFDGDPGHPDLDTLWRLAADTGVTVLGTSAPLLLACRRAGRSPRAHLDLTAIRSVGSTGAPLPPEGFAWVYEHVGDHLLLSSASGGTDVCTAFVAGAPLVAVHAGEIPARCLGARVEAFDERGRSVVGVRGELVLTAPLPSMPVGFWDDPGRDRERRAYFDRFPGVWCHGDWIEITPRGSCVITGRSDATLNRGGVRMGTSEFYAVVEEDPRVADSLVVHLDGPDGGRLLLFVVPVAGIELDVRLRGELVSAIRTALSPRHVPDAVLAVPSVPRTLSGKKLEVPIKRLLQGEPAERVVDPGALADPRALEPFLALAASGQLDDGVPP